MSDQNEMNDLLIALHDAINSPKGVVPYSAEAFYDQDHYRCACTTDETTGWITHRLCNICGRECDE